MDRRVKASLVWGAIGAFSFLVLIQGYELLSADRLGFGLKFAIAAVVGAGAAGSTYLVEPIYYRS